MASNPHVDEWIGRLVLIGIIALLLILAYIVFAAGHVFDKLPGDSGRMVMTRLLGVLLAALSVQYVANGATALFVTGVP